MRKKQIVGVARRLIIQYGSEHLTVRRIARHVDISEAAIYRHFKSKREILSLLVEDIEQTWMSEVDEGSNTELPALEKVHSIILNRISTAEQRGGISFQVIAEIISLGDKKLNKQVTGVVESYINRLASIITTGCNKGELRDDVDPKAAATIFYGMIQGLVNIWALSNYEFNLVERYTPCWDMLQGIITRKLSS